MKKFLLGALCCACVSSVYAGTCEKTSIEYKGVQQSADDEFLYENDTDSFLGSGYECDNEFCEDGVTVTMFPGHFYKDEKVNETVTYKCSTGVTGDKWEPVSNDVSGDIVSTRWCDNVTKEGEYNIKHISKQEKSYEEKILLNCKKILIFTKKVVILRRIISKLCI